MVFIPNLYQKPNMRTDSVNSHLVDALEKAVQAQKHLDEAVAEVTSLPVEESNHARRLLEPVANQLAAAISQFRHWVETPPS